MEKLEFNTSFMCGKSRRKVEDVYLSFGDIKPLGEEARWTCKVFCSGRISVDKELDGNSAFDCVTLGMAFLRQSLRALQSENPGIKFYEECDGELEEITVEDIFWTHDCITDEVEEMVAWAKDNGFKPE